MIHNTLLIRLRRPRRRGCAMLMFVQSHSLFMATVTRCGKHGLLFPSSRAIHALLFRLKVYGSPWEHSWWDGTAHLSSTSLGPKAATPPFHVFQQLPLHESSKSFSTTIVALQRSCYLRRKSNHMQLAKHALTAVDVRMRSSTLCVLATFVQFFALLVSTFGSGFDAVQRNLPWFPARNGDTLLKHQVITAYRSFIARQTSSAIWSSCAVSWARCGITRTSKCATSAVPPTWSINESSSIPEHLPMSHQARSCAAVPQNRALESDGGQDCRFGKHGG